MDCVLMVFSSVTVANRAKKLAIAAFDYAAVVQLPPKLGIRGCNYCLRIKRSDYETMLELARENGLKIKAVFLKRNVDGEKEYTKL